MIHEDSYESHGPIEMTSFIMHLALVYQCDSLSVNVSHGLISLLSPKTLVHIVIFIGVFKDIYNISLKSPELL